MKDAIFALATFAVVGILLLGSLIAFWMGDDSVLVWVIIWGVALLGQIPWLFAWRGQVIAREREYKEAVVDRLQKYA